MTEFMISMYCTIIFLFLWGIEKKLGTIIELLTK
jgi:hypothetical protein